MFKVLVVDDDKDVSLFITRLLEKRFMCSVLIARDGLEALAVAKSEKPEVIFLDITMPGMDGIETLESLKSDNDLKKIPVIMLTAIGEKNIFVKAMALGAVDYILKPLIYLPVYERIKEIFNLLKYRKQSGKVAHAEVVTPKTDKELILVIDGDDEFVQSFSLKMSDGYEIISAGRVTDALKIFKEKHPKLVCIGTGILGIDQIGLARKVREAAGENELTIYALEDDKIGDEDRNLFDMIIAK